MQNARRFVSVDGIKGLALLGVVFYHVSQRFLPGGFIGVDILLTLSGFLLGWSLLNDIDAHGRIRWGRWYARRAARLWPALAVMVMLTCLVGALIGAHTIVGMRGQSVAALTFTSNWYGIATGGSYFASVSAQLLKHLWFVALMVQCVVLMPVVVDATYRYVPSRQRIAVPVVLGLCSAVAMAACYRPGSDPTRVYYGTDTHSFSMWWGLALAWSWRILSPRCGRILHHPWSARIMPWVATVILVALMVMEVRVGADGVMFRVGLPVVSLLTMVMVVASEWPGSWMADLFRWKPLALLGRYSYGIYLWHWPVWVLTQAALPAWRDARVWRLWLIAALVTLAASVLSWYWVERPVRQAVYEAWSVEVPSGLRAAAQMRCLCLLRQVAALQLRGVIAVFVVVFMVIGYGYGLRVAPNTSPLQEALQRNQAALNAQSTQRQQDARAKAEAQERERQLQQARAKAKREAERTLTGDQVSAIGDSVMVGASNALQAALPGIVIDAQVSRHIAAAPGIVESLKAQGQLRKFVIVGLNTNGTVSQADFDAIAAAAGDGHVLVIVNAHGDRSWIPGANQAAAAYVQSHPTTSMLVDWDGAIGAHPEWLGDDGIHPMIPGPGVDLYAASVKDAMTTWIAAQQVG